MRDQSSRSENGPATPTCPDCGHEARMPDGPDPRRHAPIGRHAETCPVRRAEDEQGRRDAEELARRGPGAGYSRPISYAEAALFEMTGSPIPRNMRRRVRVHVTGAGPGSVLRVVVYDGKARAAMIAAVPEVTR